MTILVNPLGRISNGIRVSWTRGSGLVVIEHDVVTPWLVLGIVVFALLVTHWI